MEILFGILGLVLACVLSARLFVCGPQLIEAFINKCDEWAQIIDAFKEDE